MHMKPTDKEHRIFYGWYIIAVGVVGAIIASGTSQLFMSIMLKPITEEFGWSRSAATGAITAGTVMAGLLSFPFGKIVDRYGPRVLTSVGALIIAGAYFAISQFEYLWQFYVIFIVARIVSMNAVAGIVPKTTAVNWFRRLRGRALGFISMASPLGSAMLVFIAQLIMLNNGWRFVFIAFAAAMVFFQVFPAALILRRRPEDIGLVPDGGPGVYAPSTLKGKIYSEEEYQWTLSQAIRTKTLWLLIVANIVMPTVGAGIGFHLASYYTDVGIDATIAVGAISVYALTGAFANVIWGFLSERFTERFLAAAAMALTAVAIVYLQSVRTTTGAFIFAIVYGLTLRGEGTLFNIILAQYYGRNSYGGISGFVFPFHMLGLGFGPMISSISFDLTGSYQNVFSIYIAISILTALLLLCATKPVPPAERFSSQ